MTNAAIRSLALVVFLAFLPRFAVAQEPQCPCPPAPPPPPVWTGAANAGLGVTGGNTDIRTVNLSFDATRDPKTRNVFKTSALFLWGQQDGEDNVNRLSFLVRDEHKLNPRAFVFGQLEYLRDPFKEIDYLLAPTGGVGYKLYEDAATMFSVDGGAGGVWERNPGFDTDFSGAVTAGQQFSHKVSATALLTQRFSALWKMDDFDDALYTFGVNLAAAVTTRTQVKVELLDTYKNKPPNPGVEKNDVAFLVSFGYKF